MKLIIILILLLLIPLIQSETTFFEDDDASVLLLNSPLQNPSSEGQTSSGQIMPSNAPAFSIPYLNEFLISKGFGQLEIYVLEIFFFIIFICFLYLAFKKQKDAKQITNNQPNRQRNF